MRHPGGGGVPHGPAGAQRGRQKLRHGQPGHGGHIEVPVDAPVQLTVQAAGPRAAGPERRHVARSALGGQPRGEGEEGRVHHLGVVALRQRDGGWPVEGRELELLLRGDFEGYEPAVEARRLAQLQRALLVHASDVGAAAPLAGALPPPGALEPRPARPRGLEPELGANKPDQLPRHTQGHPLARVVQELDGAGGQQQNEGTDRSCEGQGLEALLTGEGHALLPTERLAPPGQQPPPHRLVELHVLHAHGAHRRRASAPGHRRGAARGRAEPAPRRAARVRLEGHPPAPRQRRQQRGGVSRLAGLGAARPDGAER
mmetsp:Transcript_2145/g.5003  ORF Transcript_2145/g.5003 Transcript_2145/m.5003 type:complete len:315 (-) Transcript_2145:824-1768(-)